MRLESLSAFWSVLALALTSGCSAPQSGVSLAHGGGGEAPPAATATGGSTGEPGTGGSLNLLPSQSSDSAGTGAVGGAETCATQKASATITRQSVDIIVVIDNSGSMQDEIDAVARSINVNFANVLTQTGVDYRVILISRHAKAKRQTSICVLAPLSSTTTCPPTPDQPAFSDRFYQYSLKVDSTNSLVLINDTYHASPTAPDEFMLAPMGWSAWLRPSAQKVFLEITDDNSDDMTSADFDRALLALSPDNFGSVTQRKYVFHSIIGIPEKTTPTAAWLPTEPIQDGKCTGNGDKVENSGVVYQELSRLTGGLRFPICQFNAFDTVFDTIANNVASHAGIACDFDIPPAPADRELDLSKVAVSYDPGDGTGSKTFGQAKSQAECVPDAFYIDGANKKIVLCPAACTAAQTAAKPNVDVLFTCSPTYVGPK